MGAWSALFQCGKTVDLCTRRTRLYAAERPKSTGRHWGLQPHWQGGPGDGAEHLPLPSQGRPVQPIGAAMPTNVTMPDSAAESTPINLLRELAPGEQPPNGVESLRAAAFTTVSTMICASVPEGAERQQSRAEFREFLETWDPCSSACPDPGSGPALLGAWIGQQREIAVCIDRMVSRSNGERPDAENGAAIRKISAEAWDYALRLAARETILPLPPMPSDHIGRLQALEAWCLAAASGHSNLGSTPESAGPSGQTVGLDRISEAILGEMNRRPNCLGTQEDLAAWASMNRETVRNRLANSLLPNNYVENHGKGRGYSITPLGTDAYRKAVAQR